MTVQNLINQLELQPPDMEVLFYDEGNACSIQSIVRKFMNHPYEDVFDYEDLFECSEDAKDAKEYLILR